MTQEQARQRGYRDAGYCRNHAEAETKLAEIRALKFRAVLVIEKPNPLSRGCHGNSYSVFAEKKYSDWKEMHRLEKKVANHLQESVNQAEYYAKELARIEKEKADLLSRQQNEVATLAVLQAIFQK